MVYSKYRIMSLTVPCRHQGARRWSWLNVKGNKTRSRHTKPCQLHLGYPLTQFLSSSVYLDGKTLDLSKSHSDLSKALLCLSIRSPHLDLPWLVLRRHGTFVIILSPFVIPGFCLLLSLFSFALSQGSIRGLLFLPTCTARWRRSSPEELSSEGFDQKAARKGKKKQNKTAFLLGQESICGLQSSWQKSSKKKLIA